MNDINVDNSQIETLSLMVSGVMVSLGAAIINGMVGDSISAFSNGDHQLNELIAAGIITELNL